MNTVPTTARPRPPAKVRRSPSNHRFQPSPPPPYAAGFTFPLSPSPVGMTRESPNKLGHSSSLSVTGISDDWMNDMSREDLSEILKKADGLIKFRANALGLTSAVARSLHQKNASLKIQHEALLARIPSSPGCSPLPSPLTPASNLPDTPHFYSASLSRPGIESVFADSPSTDPFLASSDPQPYLGRPRRIRKISVSPADIALLSDQNAELLNKLEKLESESAQADQAGRRKLKKLEKDILGLKEELEMTRQRGEELEEKAKIGVATNRKEKIKKLRRKPSWSENEHEEIKDFAPGGSLAVTCAPVFPSTASPELKQENEPSTPPRPIFNIILNPSTPTKSPQSRSSSSTQSTPRQEYGLVSQLLSKIRELEETNEQITQQQADTATKLESVQRDAETIGRVYECLGGEAGVDWEIIPEDGCDEERGVQADDGSVIRFRSLRRTIEGDLLKAFTAQAAVKDRNSRPSVVGFFDGVLESGFAEPDVTIRGISFPEDCCTENDTADSSFNGPTSPSLSTSSILTPHSQALQQLVHMDAEGQTPLSSELGRELGYDWGPEQAAPSHHLRTSSLYDLSNFGSPSPPLLHRPPNPTPNHASNLQSSDSQLSRDSNATCTDEPPSDIFASHRSRFHKMSRTIRTRTNRWVDGRFKDQLLGDDTEVEMVKEPTAGGTQTPLPIPVPERLARAFDHVPETFATTNGSQSPTVDEENSDKGLTLAEQEPEKIGKKEKAKQGVTAFIFELWIWFQFAIIILVFIWAMAKRGPKRVLEAADRTK